jgi:DNA-binding CsgD family transcriptional regulator
VTTARALPHLVQAYRNAEAFGLLTHAAGLPGHVPVILDHERHVENPSPKAREIFARYFTPQPRGGTVLPEMIEGWVRNQIPLPHEKTDPPIARELLVIARDGHRLVVRLLSSPAQHLLLLTEERTAVDPVALAPLGLTRRQAEILSWVAEGKTNDEIGLILGVRPRTVAKRLEMMFSTLGVENRTMAAARALELLRSPAEPYRKS